MDFWIENVWIPRWQRASADATNPLPSRTSSKDRYDLVDVAIAAGQIASITVSGDRPTPDRCERIDGTDKLLLPGWVNAHTHSMEAWTRGTIPPLPLELWLAELYGRPLADVEQIYWGAALTAVETLLSGGTTVVDHLVLMPGYEWESLEAATRAYQQVGIRAYIAPLIQDEPFEYSIPGGRSLTPEVSPMPTKDVLALMEAAVQALHRPEEGIHVAIAPTGIQLCSDELFVGAADLSDRYGICRHGHLLETRAQQLLAQEKFGHTAVTHLDGLGFLSPKTSLAHCIWLDDRDIDLMAASGTTAVHNPLSNLRLGSGIAPLLKYRERGVNVSFGCDGAASNDGQSLFEVLKIGSMLHNITDTDYSHWLSPQQVSQMASMGGAKGLNSDRFGQLAVGQDADLVLYRLDELSMLPLADPVGQLIWGRPLNVVDRAWVKGQLRVADGTVLGLARQDLVAGLRQYDRWSQSGSTAMRERLEAPYRKVMGLNEP